MSVLGSPVMVPAGSRMTWVGQFGGWSSSDYSNFAGTDFGVGAPVAIQAVQASLQNNYSLVVEKSSYSQDGSITLSLRSDIQRGDGINDDGLTDIQGNVDNAFSLTNLPVASSGITNYTAAGSDSTTGTAPKRFSPSLYDTVMADTVGVAFRAVTGNVDPWTKANAVSEATAAYIAAGATPAQAATQAQADATNALKSFSLGGSDKIGADPSQAKVSLPSATSFFGTLPSWVPWVAGGVAVLVVLYVLAPYFKVATRE